MLHYPPHDAGLTVMDWDDWCDLCNVKSLQSGRRILANLHRARLLNWHSRKDLIYITERADDTRQAGLLKRMSKNAHPDEQTRAAPGAQARLQQRADAHPPEHAQNVLTQVSKNAHPTEHDRAGIEQKRARDGAQLDSEQPNPPPAPPAAAGVSSSSSLPTLAPDTYQLLWSLGVNLHTARLHMALTDDHVRRHVAAWQAERDARHPHQRPLTVGVLIHRLRHAPADWPPPNPTNDHAGAEDEDEAETRRRKYTPDEYADSIGSNPDTPEDADPAAALLWRDALQELQIMLPPATYATHLADTTAHAIIGDTLIIVTHSPLAAEFINGRLVGPIGRTLTRHAGPPNVRAVTAAELSQLPPPVQEDRQRQPETQPGHIRQQQP